VDAANFDRVGPRRRARRLLPDRGADGRRRASDVRRDDGAGDRRAEQRHENGRRRKAASPNPPASLVPPRLVLSDRTIARLLAERRIEIDPYDDDLLQPSSVDVRVDRFFRVFHNNRYPYIDVREEQEDLTELVEVDGDRPFVLHPGEFVLGSTLERIHLADDLVARLDGKSSLGRLGLLIHSTAGFIDPGWDGHVTLELSNVANLPVTIYPGMKIGQISFVQLSEPARTPYGSDAIGSKYQGQRGPTPSRYWQNFRSAARNVSGGGST
jgi:dCTP deaminase